MSASQRNKGATYEREIAKVFTDLLGSPVKRKIGQSRDGGNDLDVPPLVVECKRRKSLKTIEGWMAQAEAAARTQRAEALAAHKPVPWLVPTVVMRADEGQSMVLLALADFIVLAGPELRKQQRLASPAWQSGAGQYIGHDDSYASSPRIVGDDEC